MENIELEEGIGEPFHGCTSLTLDGITAPLGVAGVILLSINTNKSIIDLLSTPQMVSMSKVEEKKTELIKGVWKDYLHEP